MFKTNSLPQRSAFCVSSDEFRQDIEAIYKDQEERNKLYYCIDDKPPQQLKFHQIEEFLKGTHNLELDAQNLRNVLDEVEQLKSEINDKINNLKQTVQDHLNK